MQQIVNYVNYQGKFETPNIMIEMAFWFNLSSYISLINPKITYDGKVYNINFYGIPILSSGAGKSFSYKQTKKLLLKGKEPMWKEQLRLSYLEANNGEDETIIGEQKIKLINYLPNYENSIEGTREGIYLRALALSKCFVGSLNFVSEEIMDLILESQIDTLKELYDGVYLGKIIKGAINDNIYGLRTNALLFGSSVGLKKDKTIYNKFAKALSSGIYRRSFIYYEEPKDIVKHNLKYVDEPDLNHIRNLLNMHIEDAIKGKFNLELMLTKDAENMINNIGEELITFANENKYDERYSAELGSLEKIIKLSALHSIYKNKLTIEPTSVEYAYNFYKICRDSVKGLFAIEPQHIRLYKILENSKKPLTKSEMIEIENATINKSQLKDDLLYMEEYAYRKNKKILTTGDKIKFYQLIELEDNKLNKCIVSIPKEDKGVKTNLYTSIEIPFFGLDSMEQLVKSEIVSNYTLCHFIDGKRRANNVKDKINVIAFDIDDGLYLYDAREKLKNYIYIIYTTRNHQLEKNGIIADRFRILIPLSKNIFLTNDRYKQFIKNIAKFLEIEPIDEAALDISRLWFTNSETKIYKNEDGIILNPEPFMPETEIEQATNKQIEMLDNDKFKYESDEELERRINGAIRKFLKETYKGNRNKNLFRYAMLFKDLVGSEKAKKLTLFANSKLLNPLDEKEIERTIFKSL